MKSKGWAAFFLIAVTLIFSLMAFLFYSEVGKEKSLRIKKETELSAKLVELVEIQAKLTKLTAEKNETESKLSDKIASLESAMKDSDLTIKSQAEKMDALAEENGALKKEIEEGERRAADLAAKTRALEADKAELSEKIKSLEASKLAAVSPEPVNSSDAATDITWTADMDTVDLGKIVIQKSSGKAAVVQHVDSLYGFIVISAGREDGLSNNAVVNILRNKQMIGKAVVQKTETSLSAAVILPRWTKGEVREGDVISRF